MQKIVKFSMYILLAFTIVGCTSETKMISREDAEKSALETIDGTVSNYQEMFDDKEPHHLFDIEKDGQHYEVKVNRETGKVISSAAKEVTESTNDSLMDEEEAKTIAMQEVKGGNIVKVSLDGPTSKKIYTVTIHHNSREYVVQIDAKTKKVLDTTEHEID